MSVDDVVDAGQEFIDAVLPLDAKCVWRVTYELNMQGIGTSFPLDGRRPKCHDCAGYNTSAECYTMMNNKGDEL